jgi:hypothetical protein
MNDESRSRLNSGNACYHSVRLFSLHLLSRNVKVKTYKTAILSLGLYGCESWSLTLREEHRLRVYENRVLRKNWTKGGWSNRRMKEVTQRGA